jgi:hypothetical protein
MGTSNFIGTSFFGAYERESDGSFITTKWLCIGIPIIPLSSFRVENEGAEYSRRGVFAGEENTTITRYQIHDRVPLYTKGIKKFYGVALSVLLVIFAVFYALSAITGQNLISGSNPFVVGYVLEVFFYSFFGFAFAWGFILWSRLAFKPE